MLETIKIIAILMLNPYSQQTFPRVLPQICSVSKFDIAVPTAANLSTYANYVCCRMPIINNIFRITFEVDKEREDSMFCN